MTDAFTDASRRAAGWPSCCCSGGACTHERRERRTGVSTTADSCACCCLASARIGANATLASRPPYNHQSLAVNLKRRLQLAMQGFIRHEAAALLALGCCA
jgi:hypothetical protein